MSRPLGGVRLRLTLVATVVTGLAVLLAGSWLVRTVESSLTDEVATTAEERLAAVAAALEAGRAPDQLDLAALATDVYVQVLAGGRVLAASPGITADGTPVLVPLDRRDAAAVARALGLPGRARLTTVEVTGPDGDYEVVAASSLSPVRHGVDAVQHGLLVAFPLLVGAVAALTWVLAGRALHPVESIRAQVEAISGSTLDRRVPVPSSGDEVARLARTMNAMLDRLEGAATRQQQFVADASHELRSPVTAIRTELEVAQRTAGPDDWPAVADRVLAEEARLEAVISDLLLLASLDEAAASRGAGPVDLAAVVDEEVARTPGRDGVALAVGTLDDGVLHGQATQLRRAVANLLDNALRHARSHVDVAVHHRGDRLRLLVDDDGPGIPEADRERVFERFTRLDGHRARTPGGSGAGLGLSLVRRIAELHGGTATVDTSPLGGARLVLDLPALGDDPARSG